MASRTVTYEVRYRPAATGGAWVTERFPASSTVSLTNLTRAGVYELQIRGVDARGQVSAWAAVAVTVGNTNRIGAAALPNAANVASVWDIDTTVSYAASTTVEGVSTATVSVSAGTLVIGSRRFEYGASSATIDGEPDTEVTLYMYYEDPEMLGGTRELHLTTDYVDSANADGRVAIPAITLKFPEPGGTSSGGGSAGGGGGSGGSKGSVSTALV